MRPVLLDVLGGPLADPSSRCDLEARVVDTRQMDGYVRETVMFQSRPNVTVFGYFLAPRGLDGPAPAVLCLHGHGRGVDDIVGIEESGEMRSELGGYQADFALQCVARGYPVLAIEQMGFGHRRDEKAREQGPGNATCQSISGAALLLGETTIGWRVWDAMRALDYMSGRPEVDAGRMAAMGISGGGTTTFFSACVDDRIKVAVVSGYDIHHCIDNYPPGILKYGEMHDFAGLIPPRAMFVEVGDEDSIFPEHATRLAVDRARESFRMLGDESMLSLEVFGGEHQFHGVGAFEFLSETL